MLAVDASPATAAWDRLGSRLPRPRAVLVASAHWLTRVPAVGSAVQPATIHDFGGFPQALFQVQYPAPGDPDLARDVAALLTQARLPAVLDPGRGLDHGVWVVLRHLFPDAGVPVVPLALQPSLGPAHHYRLGQALSALREQGVLVIGSGSLTHNLHEVRFGDNDETNAPAYVREFRDWFAHRLAAGDVDALLDYRRLAPAAARAHPTDEHLLPIFVALGAAGASGPVRRWHHSIAEGVLAMDAYAFGEPATAARATAAAPLQVS